MFDQSLAIEGPASRWPLVSSVMMQATAVCVLLAVPLIWVEQLPAVPPLPPEVFAPRILPPAIKVFASGVIRPMTARLTAPVPFAAPARIPDRVNMVKDITLGEPQVAPVGTGIGDLTSPFAGSPLGSLPAAAPAAPQAVPQAAAAPPASSLRVSSSIQASKLIHQIKPPYPPLARQTRVQGVVRLHAIIARDGSIQQLRVLMGHPLLVPAAVNSVKQWRYSATVLNGEPVEVVTQIDVNFVLGP